MQYNSSPMPIVTPYLGQVANRCKLPTSKLASGGSPAMSRTVHKAFDRIVNPRIIIPNFYGKLETSSGGVAKVTASIEYPVGVFTRATFAGAVSYDTPDGELATTDPIPVIIPSGATFYSRIYIERADGVLLWTNNRDSIPGDGHEYGAGITDKTMGGSVTQSTSSNFAPIAIIAMTTRPSFALIGDSLMSGVSYSGGTGMKLILNGDKGIVAPTIGQVYGYIDLAIGGDTADEFITHHAKRSPLFAYCSHIISNYGINDIANQGQSAVTVLGKLITIAGYFTGKPFYQCTLSPVSTTTDAWATVVNQTTHATNAQRVLLNASIRNNELTGALSYIEIADVTENIRDSGIWKAKYTSDGWHTNTLGGMAIVGSNAINPAIFRL